MYKKDPRTPALDPREPVWLSLVTILFCLAEGALITLVLLDFRAMLFGVTAWLTARATELSAISEQRWGFPLVIDSVLGVPVVIDVQRLWLIAIVSTTVFSLLGLLIAARKATRAVLEATYTSSGSFRRRKAHTLSRLDQMLD